MSITHKSVLINLPTWSWQKSLYMYNIMFLTVVQHSESDMFNNFLKEMKSDFIGTRYSAFWDKVVAESVSLITSAESDDSSVSQDEAKQVLTILIIT